MAQRRNVYSANEVIAFLQDIPSDESDADGSTNMDTEYEDVNYDSTAESNSDASELESLFQAKPPSKRQRPMTVGKVQLRMEEEDNEEAGALAASDASTAGKGKDGSTWLWASEAAAAGRMQQHNVFRARPGPTAYATRKILFGSAVPAFRVFFDERMMQHIQKCTEAEGEQ